MNTTTRKARSLTAAIITFGSLVTGANAAVTITFSDEASGVRITASGTLNTSGMTVPGASGGGGNSGYITQETGSNGDMQFFVNAVPQAYTNFTGGTVTNRFTSATVNTGDDINNTQLTEVSGSFGFDTTIGSTVTFRLPSATPGSATAGDTIAVTASVFMAGTTVSSLNLNQGELLRTPSGDTVNLVTVTVPEPSSFALLGLSCLSLTFRRQRRT